MLFSTPFFLFVFLPAFLVLYWVIPARRLVLLLGSTIFYAWSEPRFILIVFASTLFDWLLGRRLAALPPERQRIRKFLVACGVASNLGLLIHYPVATVFPRPMRVPGQRRPNIVFVGRSFTTSIIRLLDASQQFAELDDYVYYTQSKRTEAWARCIASPAPRLLWIFRPTCSPQLRW